MAKHSPRENLSPKKAAVSSRRGRACRSLLREVQGICLAGDQVRPQDPPGRDTGN